MNMLDKIQQNVMRFRAINDGEYPEYIIIHPESLTALYKIIEVYIDYASSTKNFKIMGVKIIESSKVEEFYLVKKFNNEYYSNDKEA
jgi:hypothetical protein